MVDDLCGSCKCVVDRLSSYLGESQTGDRIRASEDDERRGRLHNIKYTASRSSASEGCPLCQLVFTVLDEDPKKEPFKTEYSYAITVFESYVCIEISDEGGIKYPLLRYYRDRDGQLPQDDIIEGRGHFKSPLRALQELGIPWIKECHESHPNYAQPSEKPLPARVLVVGSPGEPIYVHGTNGISGDYMILSHSWGKRPTLTTTTSTLTEHRNGIDLGQLPATFADAVRVTRMVGIKYLWIDSLRIIQDDPNDWMVESAKMLQYYRNAYATISALDTKDSFSGFLHDRQPNGVQVSSSTNLCLRDVFKNPSFSDILSDSVLEHRAWCFQERLISTRILVFGRSELLWECQTLSQRETSTKVNDEFSTLYKFNIAPEYMKRAFVACTSTDDLMSVWYNISPQYANRNLTKETDMLPAISGIANFVQEKTGYTYLHGLWKEELWKGLLWLKLESGRHTGAPSWSWAATTGPIVYSEFNFDISPLAKIEILPTATGNETGEILVRSRCRDIVVRKPDPAKFAPEHTSEYYFRVAVPNNHLHTDKSLWMYDVMVVVDDTVVDDPERGKLGLANLDCDVEVGEGKRYKAMEVVENRPNNANFTTHLYFLVLEPCPGREQRWRRVGLGVSKSNHPRSWWVPDLRFEDCKYEELYLI
ncbi:heterokaryon incompatibility protein-domain-containing protein [Xylogone sp. PMI_703]|nr:heterokaryon incompatibility protein-domain-containing protein [Xylogone sp. PMI_703]